MAPAVQILSQCLLVTFLVGGMLAAGLAITPRAILAPLRDLRLVATALVLNFVAAPALSWLLAEGLALQRPHAIGLMLLGGAPGAPFLPMLAAKARGDATAAVALLALLLLGTTLFLPLALPWLLPGSEADAWSIAQPLLTLIMAPMVLGIFFKSSAPNLAAQCQPIAAKLGHLSLGALFGLLVALNFRGLLSVLGSGALGAAALFVGGLCAIGYGLGGPRREIKAVLGLSCAARNVAVAQGVAANSYRDPEITLMIVVCTVVILVLLSLAARWLRGRPHP